MKYELVEYKTVEEGAYDARVYSVEETTGQFGPQLKMKFEIMGGEYDGQTLLGWCSATYSTKSKLFAWTRAILFDGNAPAAGHILDVNDFIGRPVRIVVTVHSKDDGSEFNKIASVNKPRPAPAGNGPAAAQKQQRQAPPPPPLWEDDDELDLAL